MQTPVHVRDQRDAAFRDTLAVGLKTSGAKLLLLLAVYPDLDVNAMAGINVDKCEDQGEANVGSLIGVVLGERILADYRHLDAEAAKLGNNLDPRGPLVWMREVLDRRTQAQDPPATQSEALTDLVAKAADAIVRNLISYGRLAPLGGWSEAELLTRVRSLAAFAVNEEWRKKQ